MDNRDQIEFPIGHVVSQTAGYFSDPRVSPDGTLLAFMEHPVKFDNRGSVKVVDRNGKVSAAECEAAQATHDKKIDKKATAAHLRIVDTDSDGQISNAENAAYAKSAFVRADKNSDGSLNEDEVEDAHKAMKKEMKN